jgi:hypothetical protein
MPDSTKLHSSCKTKVQYTTLTVGHYWRICIIENEIPYKILSFNGVKLLHGLLTAKNRGGQSSHTAITGAGLLTNNLTFSIIATAL